MENNLFKQFKSVTIKDIKLNKSEKSGINSWKIDVVCECIAFGGESSEVVIKNVPLALSNECPELYIDKTKESYGWDTVQFMLNTASFKYDHGSTWEPVYNESVIEKKMTVDDLESILGYKVTIISEETPVAMAEEEVSEEELFEEAVSKEVVDEEIEEEISEVETESEVESDEE